MELNKCKRCGAFFASHGYVCPKCEEKDSAELSQLKSFLAQNDCPNSIQSLSYDTGIAVNDLNRFMENSELSAFSKNFIEKDNGNMSVQL